MEDAVIKKNLLKLPLPEVYKENLQLIKANLRESNLDWVQLNIGGEGVGKTNFSILTCQAVDPRFSEKQVAYSFEELQQIISDFGDDTCGRAILLDEGGEVLFSRDWMRKENREMIKLFMRIRKKRLFFIVNIPRLDVDKKFEGRVKTLTKCVWDITPKGLLTQGRFEFYAYDKTQRIFTTKKFKHIRPDFMGHFGLVEQGLWDALQAKNFEFLNGADVDSLAKIKDVNTQELAREIAMCLKSALGTELSSELMVASLRKMLVDKYGDKSWLSERLLGLRLNRFGFSRTRVGGQRAVIITRNQLNLVLKSLSLTPLKPLKPFGSG